MPKSYRVEKEGDLFVLNQPGIRLSARDMPNLIQAIFSSIYMGLTKRELVYADEPSSEPGSLSLGEYQEFVRLYRR